ncbi:MAG: hypothetical protein II183_00480 [Elusimicrobiaceae bacterium]|nr:hypothetical protein [Elusimicrobiaceae bacterium]
MELLIVVIIISGFAIMTYPSYKVSLERARASEAVNMLGAIQAAQQKHFVNYEEYASTFHGINDFEPGINGFDPSLSHFDTEFFKYGIISGQKKAQALRAKNGNPINKGYRLEALFEDRFIRCIVLTTEGEKVCSSLTDKAKVENYYPIF